MEQAAVQEKKITISQQPNLQRREFIRKYGAVILLLVLVIYNMIFTQNFTSATTFWNLLLHGSTTALVSIGMTLVIATAGIDLSVGAMMAIAAVSSTLFMDYGVLAVFLGTLLVVGLFGAVNGTIISVIGVQPIVVTLALMISGRGIAQVFTNGALVSFSNPTFEFIGKGKLGPVPFPVVIAAVCIGLMYFVVRYTAFGRYIEAIGDNEEAARLAGVKVRKNKVMVYVISALLASVAGMIETARLAAADATKIGLNIELDAIAAVVIGGTLLTGGKARIWGTIIGVLIMGIVTITFNYNNIPYSYSLLLKGIIIILAILVQREQKV